jgi:hypothetical protein
VDEQKDPTEREHAPDEDLEMDAEQADEVKGGIDPLTGQTLTTSSLSAWKYNTAPVDQTVKLDSAGLVIKRTT